MIVEKGLFLYQEDESQSYKCGYVNQLIIATDKTVIKADGEDEVTVSLWAERYDGEPINQSHEVILNIGEAQRKVLIEPDKTVTLTFKSTKAGIVEIAIDDLRFGSVKRFIEVEPTDIYNPIIIEQDPEIVVQQLQSELEGLQQAIAELTILLAGGGA